MLRWRLPITLIIIVFTAYSGAIVNYNVFRYLYTHTPLLDYSWITQETCVGLIVKYPRLADLFIQPGRLVCTTSVGEPVYESAMLQVRIGRGYYLLTDLLTLYINTTQPLSIRFVVEYPARKLNAELSISHGKSELARLLLEDTATKSIIVEPGTSAYTLSIRIIGADFGDYSFRVGLYVELVGTLRQPY